MLYFPEYHLIVNKNHRMEKFKIFRCAVIMLLLGCNSDDVENQNVSYNIIENLKSGTERYVVLDSYNVQSFYPHNKYENVQARATLDTETDVIELTSNMSGFSPSKNQFKIESFIHSDKIYASYRVVNFENNKPLTLVLVNNGFIIGSYPADLNEVWIIYFDSNNGEQVGEDFGHYLNGIEEDLSFEIK